MDSFLVGKEIFFKIEAPHFVAGFTLGADESMYAPIIRYMHGWDLAKICDYCSKKGWKLYKLPSPGR